MRKNSKQCVVFKLTHSLFIGTDKLRLKIMVISCPSNTVSLFNEIKLPKDVKFIKLSNVCLSLLCYTLSTGN